MNYNSNFPNEKTNLALMQGKNLAFSASFGKAAGKGFIKKAQAIRSKNIKRYFLIEVPFFFIFVFNKIAAIEKATITFAVFIFFTAFFTKRENFILGNIRKRFGEKILHIRNNARKR